MNHFLITYQVPSPRILLQSFEIVLEIRGRHPLWITSTQAKQQKSAVCIPQGQAPNVIITQIRPRPQQSNESLPRHLPRAQPPNSSAELLDRLDAITDLSALHHEHTSKTTNNLLAWTQKPGLAHRCYSPRRASSRRRSRRRSSTKKRRKRKRICERSDGGGGKGTESHCSRDRDRDRERERERGTGHIYPSRRRFYLGQLELGRFGLRRTQSGSNLTCNRSAKWLGNIMCIHFWLLPPQHNTFQTLFTFISLIN